MSSSREPQQTATESGGHWHSLQSVDRRRRVQPWPRFLLPKCDEDLSSTSLFAARPVSASPSVGRYLRERRAQADQQRTQNDRGSAATGSREGEHSSGHREARERSDGDRERGAKRSEAQHRFAGLRSAEQRRNRKGCAHSRGPTSAKKLRLVRVVTLCCGRREPENCLAALDVQVEDGQAPGRASSPKGKYLVSGSCQQVCFFGQNVYDCVHITHDRKAS